MSWWEFINESNILFYPKIFAGREFEKVIFKYKNIYLNWVLTSVFRTELGPTRSFSAMKKYEKVDSKM